MKIGGMEKVGLQAREFQTCNGKIIFPTEFSKIKIVLIA